MCPYCLCSRMQHLKRFINRTDTCDLRCSHWGGTTPSCWSVVVLHTQLRMKEVYILPLNLWKDVPSLGQREGTGWFFHIYIYLSYSPQQCLSISSMFNLMAGFLAGFSQVFVRWRTPSAPSSCEEETSCSSPGLLWMPSIWRSLSLWSCLCW